MFRPLSPARAPHAWLAPGHSTIDLFGRGFTLLDLGAGAGSVELLQRAAQTAWLSIHHRHCVSMSGLRTIRSRARAGRSFGFNGK
jgi:hypothetical protein